MCVTKNDLKFLKLNLKKIFSTDQEIYSLKKAFPDASFLNISKQIAKFDRTHIPQWREQAGAWNAVKSRYDSTLEYNQIFSDIFKEFGPTPSLKYRYLQDQNLFLFFISGGSLIESFCYGMYAIASIIDPKKFPINTSNDRRNINAENTSKKYQDAFHSEKFSMKLIDFVESDEYKQWKLIRNVLIHRVAPFRSVTVESGIVKNEIEWVVSLYDNQEIRLCLDEHFTMSRCKWICKNFNNLMIEADAFTNSKIDNLLNNSQ